MKIQNNESLIDTLWENRLELLEFIRVKLIDESMVEDVFQDLARIVWRKQEVYENRGKVENYFRKIARNLTKSYNRRKILHDSLFVSKIDYYEQYAAAKGEEDVIRYLTRKELLERLEIFGTDIRQIFELRDKGYKAREIAEMINESVDAVNRKIYKYLGIIKKWEKNN